MEAEDSKPTKKSSENDDRIILPVKFKLSKIFRFFNETENIFDISKLSLKTLHTFKTFKEDNDSKPMQKSFANEESI